MPKNPTHSSATRCTRLALERIISSDYFVDSQEPVTLSDSEPEPDIVVIRNTFEDYTERYPGVDDIALIIEVSDPTLSQDRGSKKRIYAREGIPIYWIVNLVDNQVEIYTNPTGENPNPDYTNASKL